MAEAIPELAEALSNGIITASAMDSAASVELPYDAEEALIHTVSTDSEAQARDSLAAGHQP